MLCYVKLSEVSMKYETAFHYYLLLLLLLWLFFVLFLLSWATIGNGRLTSLIIHISAGLY